MGRKKHRHDWPEAKKLCRLNQDDIAMAKALGFGPDALIRARPDPKQQWKLPVKEWVRELYRDRFGTLLGEEHHPPAPMRSAPELTEEEMRRFEVEFCGEDSSDRLEEEQPLPAPMRSSPELTEAEMLRFEEELYWEDYAARNEEAPPPKKPKVRLKK